MRRASTSTIAKRASSSTPAAILNSQGITARATIAASQKRMRLPSSHWMKFLTHKG